MYINKFEKGFSLAEALITLLIVSLITIATIPVITKKHRTQDRQKHGMYACYWNGNSLVAKQMIDGTTTTGTTTYDSEEGREGCVFDPPAGAKNFVVTIVGGGGGGSGSGSSSRKISFYTEAGDYTYTTPTVGFYEFLAVGAGGGGGDGMYDHRACTASTGGLVYVPAIVIPKDTKLNITVGTGGVGGSASSSSSATGTTGGTTSIIEQMNGTIYATATGGEGGCSYYWRTIALNDYQKKQRSFIGWSLSGSTLKLGYIYQGDAGILMKSFWQQYALSVYPGKAGKGSSDIKNAVVYNGKRLGALSTTDHQNSKEKYNMLPELTQYSDQFAVDFNKVTLKEELVDCHLNISKNSLICKRYSNHYGAGGGGGGQYSTLDCSPATGQGGFVGISRKPAYAGLGGEAGKVVQISYAEMPSKTLLFPGKGGSGGLTAPNIKKNLSQYIYNEQTAGGDGQSSYVKNGSQILGGKGAVKINPDATTSYSQEVNSQNMPIGTNGKMSDILTSKKVGTGGLGGLNTGDTTNTSINGLTQTVFRNGEVISSFKNIYGAGSGGGGGAISVSGSTFELGKGGAGSSGLVFIQW